MARRVVDRRFGASSAILAMFPPCARGRILLRPQRHFQAYLWLVKGGCIWKLSVIGSYRQVGHLISSSSVDVLVAHSSLSLAQYARASISLGMFFLSFFTGCPSLCEREDGKENLVEMFYIISFFREWEQ
jgi:hypothetical protein